MISEYTVQYSTSNSGIFKQELKGAVYEIFWHFFYFMNRSHLGP